jgi:uncharacterized protein RhaS with RHS repeats
VYDITTGMGIGCWKETTTDPKNNVTEKAYDRLGRLKTVTAGGQTTTYNYDANGKEDGE